ncbi:hypothetical protein B0H15DRAFT_652518 [Mycena belliarum]|uniref:Uncharacterized protein n=1 Tax=Mycena belliarum TaxID=1033014 RepID=A0AAD6TQN3_9AGAR|nr:hypothetical protein B0H15DRAFT_652518 [Mycena belliae]
MQYLSQTQRQRRKTRLEMHAPPWTAFFRPRRHHPATGRTPWREGHARTTRARRSVARGRNTLSCSRLPLSLPLLPTHRPCAHPRCPPQIQTQRSTRDSGSTQRTRRHLHSRACIAVCATFTRRHRRTSRCVGRRERVGGLVCASLKSLCRARTLSGSRMPLSIRPRRCPSPRQSMTCATTSFHGAPSFCRLRTRHPAPMTTATRMQGGRGVCRPSAYPTVGRGGVPLAPITTRTQLLSCRGARGRARFLFARRLHPPARVVLRSRLSCDV